MNATSPIDRIGQLLEQAGYRELGSPLKIADITFDLAAAYVGTGRAPDLVIVVDTMHEDEPNLVRKIEALARALDLVESKRPITTVISGPKPSYQSMEALSRVTRVLPVGATASVDFETSLRNWLAVLLPLDLPQVTQAIADPIGELNETLDGFDPKILTLVSKAELGSGAVLSKMTELVNKAMESDNK